MKAISGGVQEATREPSGQCLGWALQGRQCERCEEEDGASCIPAASIRIEDRMESPHGDARRSWGKMGASIEMFTCESQLGPHFPINCSPLQTLLSQR